MKGRMRERPILGQMQGVLRGGLRGALKDVMGCNNWCLPSHVTELDRLPQGKALDRYPSMAQIEQVVG